MWLFIDDQRVPPPGWELARTVTGAIRILASNAVSFLSLDHDIYDRNQRLSDESFEAVAYYVAVMKKTKQPKIIFIHTANMNGASKLKRILSGSSSKTIRISPVGYEDEIQKHLKIYESRKSRRKINP